MALSTQTSTSAAGSVSAHELTAEQVQRILVQPLEQASVFLSSGVRIFDTPSQLRLPKAPSSKAAALTFVGENEKIPEVDHEFDEIVLMPSTMKSVKSLTRYSNELARQSVVSLDAALKERLVADVAAKVDAQFLGAGGDGISTPKGLFGFSGVQTLAVGAALSLDAILEALALLVNANVPTTGLVLFVRPEDYIGIRGAKDTNGRYIMAPETTGGLSTPTLGILPQS